MLSDKLLAFAKQMYPKGRAFKMPFGGVNERLHKVFALSEARVIDFYRGILDSMIPDNDNFDEDDATQVERYLGIITNTSIPLADRVLAIIDKMNYPGTILTRQTATYMQYRLQQAGFDLYVYENRFDDGMGGYVTQTPGDIFGYPLGYAELNMFELGEVDLNSAWSDSGITLIANSLVESEDEVFVIGDNYRSTFFISGSPITDTPNISIDRKNELRQLILKIKPAQTVGFININYI